MANLRSYTSNQDACGQPLENRKKNENCKRKLFWLEVNLQCTLSTLLTGFEGVIDHRTCTHNIK